MFGRRQKIGRDQARRWKGPDAGRGGRRPRVLLEMPDPGEAFACWQLIERHGMAASWCPGPDGSCSGSCPLVADGQCRLAERADVVVSTLAMHRVPSRGVIEALRRHHPDTPVIVATTTSALQRWAPLLAGRRTLCLPLTAPTLLASVTEAVGGRLGWAPSP